MFYDYYTSNYPGYYSEDNNSPVANPFEGFSYPVANMQGMEGFQGVQGESTQTPPDNMNVPNQGMQPMAPMGPMSPVQNNIEYTQGYLQTLIGRRVKIEFLIGTNMIIDREGTLEQVGISYVVIKEVDTNNLVLGDIYSIKFVNIYPQPR